MILTLPAMLSTLCVRGTRRTLRRRKTGPLSPGKSAHFARSRLSAFSLRFVFVTVENVLEANGGTHSLRRRPGRQAMSQTLKNTAFSGLARPGARSSPALAGEARRGPTGPSILG
jgi:hypothetical protein